MNFSENDLKILHHSSGRAGEILGIREWNDDISLIHIFRNLYTLFGGDEKLMYHWMQSRNEHFNGRVPANLITTHEGTNDILNYLISFQNWS